MDGLRQRDFLGVGWSYPVVLDPQRGDIALSRYEKDIKEAIRIILETGRGERVMRPDFGCGIHDLVFEEMSSTVLFAVESEVRDALQLYEARIDLVEVAVDPSQAAAGLLIVAIQYRIRRTNQRDNLVYPFYFREGGTP